MKYNRYPKRDAVKNYFPMPNEVFLLDLSAGEIAVCAYLMYCEDRKTFQCHPSYKTIGSAVGLSKNTVKKHVDGLIAKQLITAEPTSIITKNGQKHNGSVTKLINNVEMLIVEYSKIAFDLGRKSLYENRAFHIASALKIIFSELTSSTLIEKEMKLSLKNIISETELDFGYAAGNHNVASLRMAQLIREYKANNGGK